MTAAETLAPILVRLDGNPNPVAGAIARDVRAALASPRSGSMAGWMREHDGARVHTVQVDNQSGRAWLPLSRTIDARARGHVRLCRDEGDGSRRDYAGMHVVHASPRCLIVADDWHTIAYALADA